MRGDHGNIVSIYEVGEQLVDESVGRLFAVVFREFILLDGIEIAWFTDKVSVSFNESLLVTSKMGFAIPERCDVASLASTFKIECRFGTIVLLRPQGIWRLLRPVWNML